jgi:PadR family transcriptional regulator, regulatory protein PadR
MTHPASPSEIPVAFQQELWHSYFGFQHERLRMGEKNEVWQGTLALMVLKTLDVMGPQHGYGVARRIEQVSENLLAVNQGTLYPVLIKLEQEGAISSEWGVSDNNRKAKFYTLTKAGRKHLLAESQHWRQTTRIIDRFFAPEKA